eukprot:s816_g14.t1
MWNYGVPYVAKQYFDCVLHPGLTFRETPDGPEGLLGNGRPLLLLTSAGGAAGKDHLTPWLLDVASMAGFDNAKVVSAVSVVSRPRAEVLAELKLEVQKVAGHLLRQGPCCEAELEADCSHEDLMAWLKRPRVGLSADALQTLEAIRVDGQMFLSAQTSDWEDEEVDMAEADVAILARLQAAFKAHVDANETSAIVKTRPSFVMRSLLRSEEPEVDLEGRGLLEERSSGRKPVYWVIGALALVAFCGFGAAVFDSKNSVVITGKDAISLAQKQKTTKSIMEQIKNPQCEDFPSLDILEVTHNNLANMGPGDGGEGIEYHAKTWNGKEIYMDLHAKAAFKSDDPKDFGMHGAYGTINVAGNSEALIEVSFRDFKTKKPVLLDDFSLSFFDIDHGRGKNGLEALTIEGDWSMAVVAKDTTVLVHHTEGNERRITFQATNQSQVLDDPSDPKVLTMNQYNKAITVRFQHANKFFLGMHVKTAASFARVFEFIGVASILCAKSPTGATLPVGQVYVNENQMKEVGGMVEEETNWWWVLAALVLGALLAALILLFFLPKKEPEYREMVVAEAPPPKQGPGIFAAAFAGGTKLGLHLDAPHGINQPPMIKKILEGAVQRFNSLGKPNAIEPYDMIIKVGDVSDPSQIMAELKKGLPDDAKLTLDRPEKIEAIVQGDLGVKLDAMEDSYGAVIMEIEPSGSIAKWNNENPSKKMNKGDRIVSVNGNTFDPKRGWTVRTEKSDKSGGGTPKKSASFGSRMQSRFLEEIAEFKGTEIEVTMLKYITFEK